MKGKTDKDPFKYFIDKSDKVYRVDRDDLGTFSAENLETGETRFVDALALESYREVTAEEVEKLGIII